MHYYFCYSSALDQSSLDQWKNQHGYSNFQLTGGKLARAENVQLVCDFPSRFWGGRVLSLKAQEGSQVYGVLFALESDSDWHIVGHKEGKVTGVSVEMQVNVHIEGTGQGLASEKMIATAFVTHPSRHSLEGPVSQKFIEALERAYQQWGLPTAQLRELALAK